MRTAIITGASSGIGKALAISLVESGFNVMLGARREDKLKALSDQLGSRAAYCLTDVTQRDDLSRLVEHAETRFGQVDILINNAGLMPLSMYASGKVDEWERMIDVHLKGSLYAINSVLPQMISRKDGHIINMASIAAHDIWPSSGVYSATKHGVRVISESLRREMTLNNIRVTTISPGAVRTGLSRSISDKAAMKDAQERFAFEYLEPDIIAETVLFALNKPSSVCVSEIVIRPTQHV